MLTKDIESFFNECKNNFGRWNKKDYEIAFLHYYLKSGHDNDSNYMLSKSLCLPESRIKQLRYEMSLRYQKDDKFYHERLKALLSSSNFKFSSDKSRIQFSVSDKMMWHYISNKLTEEGGFIDSSYISDIISITALDLMLLLSSMMSKTEAKDCVKKIKTKLQSNSEQLPNDWKESLSKLIDTSIQETVKSIGGTGANIITKWLKTEINNLKYSSFSFEDNPKPNII